MLRVRVEARANGSTTQAIAGERVTATRRPPKNSTEAGGKAPGLERLTAAGEIKALRRASKIEEEPATEGRGPLRNRPRPNGGGATVLLEEDSKGVR